MINLGFTPDITGSHLEEHESESDMFLSDVLKSTQDTLQEQTARVAAE